MGCGRGPWLMASLPVSPHPSPGVFSFDLGLDGLVFQARPRAGLGTLRFLVYWGLELQLTKPRTGSVCLPVTSGPSIHLIRLCLVGCM